MLNTGKGHCPSRHRGSDITFADEREISGAALRYYNSGIAGDRKRGEFEGRDREMIGATEEFVETGLRIELRIGCEEVFCRRTVLGRAAVNFTITHTAVSRDRWIGLNDRAAINRR